MHRSRSPSTHLEILMNHATVLYNGETGEVSASHRPASTPPGYVTSRGTQGHYLASPGDPSDRFSLYRWDMSATSRGTEPHFHRTYDETFIVISGTVRLLDGAQWIHAVAGDVLHVPAGDIHGFTNAPWLAAPSGCGLPCSTASLQWSRLAERASGFASSPMPPRQGSPERPEAAARRIESIRTSPLINVLQSRDGRVNKFCISGDLRPIAS
jgi:quercetin dioxygenase-like cupin family protein